MQSTVLVVAAMLLAARAHAQPLELKFSHFLGPTSFFQQDVAEPFARELEAKSGGRAKLEIFNAASPLGKPTAEGSKVPVSSTPPPGAWGTFPTSRDFGCAHPTGRYRRRSSMSAPSRRCFR